jgi:hypothetical protein
MSVVRCPAIERDQEGLSENEDDGNTQHLVLQGLPPEIHAEVPGPRPSRPAL